MELWTQYWLNYLLRAASISSLSLSLSLSHTHTHRNTHRLCPPLINISTSRIFHSLVQRITLTKKHPHSSQGCNLSFLPENFSFLWLIGLCYMNLNICSRFAFLWLWCFFFFRETGCYQGCNLVAAAISSISRPAVMKACVYMKDIILSNHTIIFFSF